MAEDHVTIEVNGEAVRVRRGKPLLAAMLASGVRQLHVCGGRGLCTTCRVVVEDGADQLSPMGAKERISLRGHLSFSPRVRLACQARALGPARVRSVLPQWGTLPSSGAAEAKEV
jgi:adenylate cyclase